jgi:hypothetical protein
MKNSHPQVKLQRAFARLKQNMEVKNFTMRLRKNLEKE